MKSKKLAIILGASLLAMTVTGCSHFGSFLPPEIEKVEISTEENKSFVKGDYLLDCVDVDVSTVYSNGEKREVSTSDVDLFYVDYETGSWYSIGVPIPHAGEYSLMARYQDVYSERYTFTAIENPIYAQSLQIEEYENLEILELTTGETRTITLNVAPTNFTEDIQFYSTNSEALEIVRVDRTTFELTAKEEGRAEISISTNLSSKEQFLNLRLGIIIRLPIYIQHMYFDGLDDELPVNGQTGFQIGYSPENATVDIGYRVSNDLVTLKKEGDWYILTAGLELGEVYVTFLTQKSPNEICYIYKKVTIVESYAEEIWLDAEYKVPLNASKEIYISCWPDDTYISVPPEAWLYDHDMLEITYVEFSHAHFTFEIFGKKLGETNLVFKIKTGENTWAGAMTHIIVREVFASSIRVTGPTKVNVDYEGYLYANVEPDTYSYDVSASVSYGGIRVKVKKVDRFTFKIRARFAGTALISFTAKKSGSSTIKYTHILNISGTIPRVTIDPEQNYYHINSRNLRPNSNIINPVNVLVIPVWYKDSHLEIGDYTKEEVWQDIYDSWFGDESKVKYETVRSFYYKESLGKFNLQGTVAPWQDADCKSTSITTKGGLKELGKKLVDKYFANNKSESRKNYDSTHDGFIDFVAIISASPPRGGISSYKGRVSNLACTESPTVRELISSDIYACRKYDADVVSDLLRVDPFIHETGHMFGLWDYYNTSIAGQFNMQASNNGGHDPWSVMAIGWANPIIPTETTTITINDFSSTHDFVLLTPEWNEYDSPFDEFLIVELVGRTGLNEFFVDRDRNYLKNNAGIRVYHVDARLAYKGYDPWRWTSDVLTGCSLAFDNKSVQNDVESIDNISLLQMIRSNTSRPVDYYNGGDLLQSDFFYETETFDFNSYKDQFFNYWLARHQYVAEYGEPQDARERNIMETFLMNQETMDDGRRLGWSFKVDKIYNNPDGHISATITFTKEA